MRCWSFVELDFFETAEQRQFTGWFDRSHGADAVGSAAPATLDAANGLAPKVACGFAALSAAAFCGLPWPPV